MCAILSLYPLIDDARTHIRRTRLLLGGLLLLACDNLIIAATIVLITALKAAELTPDLPACRRFPRGGEHLRHGEHEGAQGPGCAPYHDRLLLLCRHHHLHRWVFYIAFHAPWSWSID
jgi:hypothetical protein